MTKSFSEQVNDIIEKNSKLLIAVGRSAIGDLINEASTPEAKGGKMPVKTGFLRGSGKSSLAGMPTGPERGDPEGVYASEADYADDGQIRTTLAALKPGDTFYFGWTAEYANVQNTYRGFLDATIQNWPQHVERRAAEAQRRSK